MRHHWALATTALLLALAPVMGSPQALAQESGDSSIDFSVTPSRLEMRVGPGQTLQFAIQVINHSGEPLNLLTYVDDVEIPPNDLIEPDELAFTASRWTSFSNDTMTVAAEAVSEAIVTVAIPENTPSGGYHAMAFFQATGPEVDTGIVALGRIGATLLLEVAPSGSDLAREALVADTSLDVEWDGMFSPSVNATVVLDNVGDLHVTAGGIHVFRAWPGQAVHEEKVGPATVLRGTRHAFESSLEEVPLFGKVSLTSEIVYQVGPDELPVIITQASIWVIPWSLIGVLSLIAAVTAGLMFLRRKRRGQELHDELQTDDLPNDQVKAEVSTP